MPTIEELQKLQENAHKQGLTDLDVFIRQYEPKVRSAVRSANISLAVALTSCALAVLFPAGTILLMTIGSITAIYSLSASLHQKSDSKNYASRYSPVDETSVYKLELVDNFSVGNRKIEFSSLLPSEEEESLGFEVAPKRCFCRDTGFYSTKLDNAISLASTIGMQVTERKDGFLSQNPSLRHQQLVYLVCRVHSPEHTTNEEKICLDSSLETLMNACAGIENVTTSNISYFDGLVSNEAFRSVIHEIPANGQLRDGHIFADLSVNFPAYIDPKSSVPRLQSHPTHIASRHLGISTIAVTSDNQVVFFRQTKNQALSAGELVASGSGSADFQDIAKSAGQGCLLKAVKYGMARELCEEGGLLENISLNNTGDLVEEVSRRTVLTGFFRWVNRSGKPEFLAATKLDLHSQEIPGDGVEVYKISAMNNELGSWRVDNLSQIEDFMKFVEQGDDKINLSFYMALRRLAEIAQYKDSAKRAEQEVYAKIDKLLFNR